MKNNNPHDSIFHKAAGYASEVGRTVVADTKAVAKKVVNAIAEPTRRVNQSNATTDAMNKKNAKSGAFNTGAKSAKPTY